MMSVSSTLYNKLPIFLQNVACSWRGRHLLKTRYSQTFRNLLAELNEMQWWEPERLKEYQNQKVRELMAHAYENVPYYNRVMKERGLAPKDFEAAEDLVKMPYLTKEIVRREGKNMIATNINLKREATATHTSGTTGAGLKYWKSNYATSFQWAVWWRHLNRFGVRFEDSSLNFGGLTVVPFYQKRPPFWREVKSLNQVYLSTYHLKEENLGLYIDMIEKHDFVRFAGYPSAMYVLADFLRRNNHILKRPPKIISPGAETLFEVHRELFTKWFGSPVTSQYGMSEAVVNCSCCKKNVFHVDMELGVLETKNIRQTPNGQTAFVIGTGIQDYVQPFIRYKIDDVITLVDKECDCGIHSQGISFIDGRVESLITTPDGRQVGRLDHVFKDITTVRETQLVQDALDSVIIKVVPDTGFDVSSEREIIAQMTHYLGNEMSFSIEKVDSIQRTKSGKFRFVISNIIPYLSNEVEK